MTRTFKTLVSAVALITIAGSANAGDTFSATFTYNSTISVEANIAQFEKTAETACRDELDRAGFRRTEGRFEQRQCEKQLMKAALRSTERHALLASFAAATVKAVAQPKPSISAQAAKAVINSARPTATPAPVTKMASN